MLFLLVEGNFKCQNLHGLVFSGKKQNIKTRFMKPTETHHFFTKPTCPFRKACRHPFPSSDPVHPIGMALMVFPSEGHENRATLHVDLGLRTNRLYALRAWEAWKIWGEEWYHDLTLRGTNPYQNGKPEKHHLPKMKAGMGYVTAPMRVAIFGSRDQTWC